MADRGDVRISDEFHSYGAQNTEAQALDRYEAEIVPDSEDEGTHEGEVLAGTSLLSSCQIDGHTETNTMAMDTKHRILCNSCTAENALCIEGKGPLSSTKNKYTGSDTTLCETYKTCYDPTHKDDIQSPKECQCVTDSSILNASHVYDNLELNDDINLQAACSLEDLDREQKQRSPSRYCENMGFGAKSQGPDELSLAESLGFVDQYLSAHFEDVAPWAAFVVCEKSQYSISNAKGPQSLVSLASLANFKSRVNDEGVFKWVDDLEDSRKHNYQSLPGCKDLGQILQRRFMSVEDMDLRKQRIYPPVRKVTDQCSNISEKLRDTSISSGSMSLSGVTRTCYDVLRPKLESGKVSSEELDMLLNKNSYSSKLEASVEDKDADVYEVGIGTQIAAEAMEALYYADPPNDAHLHPADTSDRLANVTTQILCSEVVSIQKSPCSKPVDHKKPGACSKKQRWKSSCSLQDSNSADDSCQEPAKKRRTHRELSTSSTSVDHYSGGAKLRTKGNLKGVVQCKSKRNIRKKVVYSGNSERQCEKFLPVTRGGRQSVPSKSLKLSRTSDGNCQNGKINLKVEDDVPCKKRKTMVLIADNSDVSKQRKNSLKVSFETSSDGRNSSISQGDAKQLEREAILNLQNFNVLDYPRGKRTSRVKTGSRGRGGDFIYPVKLLNMNECNMAGSQTQGMLESKSDSVPSCFRCPIKRKKRTSIHRTISISIPEEQSCGNLHGKNVDELGQIDIVHEHNSIVKGGKVVHVTSLDMGMDQFKNQNDMKSASSLCLRKDSVSSVNSSNIVNGASFKCRMSIDELHAHNTISSHGKQPDKKRKSSSLLTKELSRLGCIDSMPDFTSKDLRRRRTMANIQVLLSQNLKKDIFKQQKKILAWFGVPMASCPSDATHFVADKFTRTRNMLEIIALGKPVVTPLWLESCKEAGFCIDERKYFLRDVKKERELGFSLPDSLIQAGQQPLLRGYKVSVTRNVKPAQEVISSLVKTLHGELEQQLMLQSFC